MNAAGIAFVTPGNLALFLRRAGDKDHPGEWAFPGGEVEQGENHEDAARREALEEIGHLPEHEVELLDKGEPDDDGVAFTTFQQHVAEEFEPMLNEEHDAYQWAPMHNPPSPLHPGVERVLASGYMDSKRADERTNVDGLAGDAALALDRDSVRRYDGDGRLHVAVTNISKANVCPYHGHEIPGWEELRLDPDRIYRLLRDPEELARAAPTFNNVQLLNKHVPVTATDHQPEIVIGSTGTDAEYVHPYLRNSLVVWAKHGIKDIESEARKDLSSGYRYRADMKPGTYEGADYDGIMRDIVGNHVALVKEGRAGADVVVGDAKLEERNKEMATKSKKAIVLSAAGRATLGALVTYLKPKMAADAKLNLYSTAAALQGVTGKNFKERKPAILDAIRKETRGQLAKDATIEDLTQLLDVLEEHPDAIDEPPKEEPAPVEGAPGEPLADPNGMLKDYLRGKGMSDDDINGAPWENDKDKAKDAGPPEFPGKPKNPDGTDQFPPKKDDDEDKDKDKDKEAKDKVMAADASVTKAAMDAAIASAVKVATDQATKQQREIREAERFVRPWVGDLVLAFDSAEAVHRAAFDHLGLSDKIKGVHASALPTILAMVPLPGAKSRAEPKLAQDAAAAKSFAERFPGTDRIRVM